MNKTRYSDIQFIASGGFAKVYRALDCWTRNIVAIKELSNLTPDLLRRFMRERDMLTAHLDNPFVVNILDSDFSDAKPYLVLEYAHLGSLQNYVVKRRDWRRVAGWLHDIAYGLTVIHERGELIRDLKPSNLLRFKRSDGSDLIKIADFGLGQRPDNARGGMTTSVFGTKGYIDPVAQLTGNFAAVSDIHSLGVTIRELATGSRSLHKDIPGPKEFQVLIASMTDSNVESRPMAREVFERIRAILQVPPTPKVSEPQSDGLGWLLAGAAIVAGVCLLADGE
jgi:serine/threonine protein kinase